MAYGVDEGSLVLVISSIHGSIQTILHHYCDKINSTPLPIFKYLIETKGGNINAQDNRCDTPIHHAFRSFNPNKGGDINTLKYLLNLKSIDVKLGGYSRHTILHSASQTVNHLPLDIFQVLIEIKGLDVNCTDSDGNTPLHLLMHPLEGKKLDDSHVPKIVEYLIKKGAKINHKNSKANTALDEFFPHRSTHPLTYDVLITNCAKLGKDC